jgi:hypothetical protein
MESQLRSGELKVTRKKGRVKTLVKVFVLRYDKGKFPPSALTDEVKEQVGGLLEEYYKENPGVKFNGLWVNEEGVGMCQWDSPDTESVKRFFDIIGETVDEIVAVEKIL